MSGAFGPSGDNSQVYPGFFENPHFAPPILAARTVNAGTMGRSEGHPHSLLAMDAPLTSPLFPH